MTNWTIKVLDIIACVLSGPFKREKWSMLGCMYKIRYVLYQLIKKERNMMNLCALNFKL
jgi:hypothetical protein